MTYKLIKSKMSGNDCGVIRDNGDGSTTSFLFDLNNTDYQEYLKWVAKGNTPDPAENT